MNNIPNYNGGYQQGVNFSVKNEKVSIVGRILSVVFGILAIVMLCGTWLKIDAFTVSKFTIFEIKDYIEKLNFFAGDDDIEIFLTLFEMVTVVIIVAGIATMIAGIIGNKKAVGISFISIALSFLVAAVFVGFVLYVKAEFRSSTYYRNSAKMFGFTAKPFLTFLFFVLQGVMLCLRDKTPATDMGYNQYGQLNPNNQYNQYNQNNQYSSVCTSCGAYLTPNVAFCDTCGTRVNAQVQSKFCTSCGSQMPVDAVFCTACGTKFN